MINFQTKIFRSKFKSWIRFVYLCNKSRFKKQKATGVNTPDFAKKTDLAILKPYVGKLDINKLTNVPGSLSSLKSKIDTLDIGKLETTPNNVM